MSSAVVDLKGPNNEKLLSDPHYCLCPDRLRRHHQTKIGSAEYDRGFENQRYRASGLNLVVDAIVLWNTVYLI
jgi:Transposase and inactivated derivatives, TnpA family